MPVTIPETIAGRISAPVPFSLLMWRVATIAMQVTVYYTFLCIQNLSYL